MSECESEKWSMLDDQSAAEPAPSAPAPSAPALGEFATAAAAGAEPGEDKLDGFSEVDVVSHPELDNASQAASEIETSLRVALEHDSVGLDEKMEWGLISVLAPSVVKARAPIDLSAVLDRSGSMSGPKIALMKKAMLFVLRHLQPQDRLGIVSYGSTVTEHMPLSYMDADGKQKAEAALAKINATDQTNLSGGLLRGLEQLAPTEDKRVRSCFLFTDGLANQGITDPAQLVSATQSALTTRPGTSVMTFGFGEDHEPTILKGLAECSTGGMYYFVEAEDKIPQAFADALGGLLSVASQNLRLTITPAPGVQLVCVETPLPKTVNGDVVEIAIGDLYSEERRDIPFQIKLPSSDVGACQPLPLDCLSVGIKFFDVATNRFGDHHQRVTVARTTDESESVANKEVEAHRVRIQVTKAMKAAQALGDRGDLTQAKVELAAAEQLCVDSVAAQDPVVQQLRVDLKDIQGDMRDMRSYSGSCTQKLSMRSWSHSMQRCAGESAYRTSTKSMMVRFATHSDS
mmetsp:Transcript_52566/g.122955  ORF Transcript_52566/g.122955 Transcript_52566/m.122955 type:complete len:517 (+) Transcript_52566:64-1614(+)